ncbi:esterase-like activity of phytase family protein [Nocardia beijingensis]|uniref:esterase-like activity of phytase family protein n=1 Tax=Nocardia beijingensis TaxID=95162 RepID=UPI0018942249|nr:esterase-like activity of phytase family protein [Nocardia beijingensis]MBF6465353.1 esterase-like activity of phytase family protein [Nocardia beijingensis]
MPRRNRPVLIAGCALALASAPVAAAAPAAAPSVRLLGEQTIASNSDFEGTVVGGLSGIDYSPRTGEFVLISDDRSSKNPARYYTARIEVGAGGVGPVTLTGTRPLLAATGTVYPPMSVDPEEIRVDPWTGDYYWTQEGERAGAVLNDPSVRITHPDGSYAGELPIPDNERMRPDAGPRRNATLEGATFLAAGALFATSMEGPLLPDGPAATTTSGALTRITIQARSGPLLAQYAYPVEPIFAESRPEPGRGETGIASILAADSLDPTKLLVLERSFSPGTPNKIRVYEADLSAATNILDAPIGTARPVTKRLLIDLDDVGLSAVDNVEGMTWGPRLPSGERTLVLVSDDNFDSRQITQIIALAVA